MRLLDKHDRRLPRLRSIRDAGREFGASTVEASTQGHVFKLRVRSDAVQHAGGGKRGKVRGFSPGSRRRLLEKLNRLEVPENERAFFVTLTYHLDLPDFETAERHRRAFLERIRRRFPKACAPWRKELQKRGAIHFHLIFLGLPMLPELHAWLLRQWQEVTGDPTITQVDLQEVQGWRKLASYVSKYIAKPQLSIEGFQDDEALDYITYLHAYSETEGRVWGLFNAAYLPWGVLEFYEWADVGWLPRLKRAIRAFQRAVSRARGKKAGWRLLPGCYAGFFLLCDSPSRWLDVALAASLA